MLDAMEVEWIDNAAVPFQFTYAINFSKYRKDHERSSIEQWLPEIIASIDHDDWELVRLYLRLRRSDMEQLSRPAAVSEESRALQVLAAMSLRTGPIDWKRLLGFAHRCSDDLLAIYHSFLKVLAEGDFILRFNRPVDRQRPVRVDTSRGSPVQ
jgi:hypothetical protein